MTIVTLIRLNVKLIKYHFPVPARPKAAAVSLDSRLRGNDRGVAGMTEEKRH